MVNMLRVHKIDDYIFAEYRANDIGMVGFLVTLSFDEFYDLENKCKVSRENIVYSRPLTAYAEITKHHLSPIRALASARCHFTGFYQDLWEFLDAKKVEEGEKNIFIGDNYF